MTIRDDTDKNNDELPIFSDRCRARDGDQPKAKPVTIDAKPIRDSIHEPLSPRSDTVVEQWEGASPGTTRNDQDQQPENTEQDEAATHIQLPSTIYGPIRTIQYSHIIDRRSLMDQLSKTIPLNQYGLPEFLYRPDLLNPDDFKTYPTVEKAWKLQETLNAAIIHIAYHQGFPTFAEGLPIWTPFPFETDEAQRAFAEYLELEGVRSIHMMISWSIDDLMEWMILNSWVPRAKAFDLYRMAYAQRKRQQRILTTEENHYEEADKLLKVATRKLGSLTQEDLDNMSIIEAAKVFDIATKIQRVSLGLPAQGAADPRTLKDTRRVKPVEEQMREIADAGNAELHRKDMEEIDLLRDGSPEAIEAAQGLLLKLHTPHEPPNR
jgi:hypothetical protein